MHLRIARNSRTISQNQPDISGGSEAEVICERLVGQGRALRQPGFSYVRTVRVICDGTEEGTIEQESMGEILVKLTYGSYWYPNDRVRKF